jgi:RHS repeat-associated protein
MNKATLIYRLHLSNHLGSSNLELDSNAALISYEEYYPFGSTSYSSGRNAAEISLKRYRYVGKERDDETGLYYYGARYYASWLCRFVSVDPLKDDYPHLNSYNYAGNKPIGDIDVDGMQGTGEENRKGGQVHTTQKGDTYSGLAEKYGTTVENLRGLNGYEDTKIPVGVKLRVNNLPEKVNSASNSGRLNFEVQAVNDATALKLNYANINQSQQGSDKQNSINYLSTASGLLGGLSSSSKVLNSNLSLPSQESPLRLKSFKGIDVAPENIYFGKRGSGRLKIKPNSNLRVPNPVKTDLKSFGNSTAKFSTYFDLAIMSKEGYEAISEFSDSGSLNNSETGDLLNAFASFATGYYYPVTGLISLLKDITLASPSFREKMRNDNKNYIMENQNRFRPDTPELERARELFLKFGGNPSELYIDNATTIGPR